MIEKHRLRNLHAIRGWAAFFVVIAHAKYPFWSGGQAYLEKYPKDKWEWYEYILFGIDMSSSFATLFVIIFFVLSGFFIARSFTINNYSMAIFYGDRIIRIYIPYIGSLLIGFMALYLAQYIYPELFMENAINRPYNAELIQAYNDLTFTSFFSSMIFLPGESGIFFGMNNPYWSLYFEGLFYLSIPFILLYGKKYMFFVVTLVLFLISFFYAGNWLTIKAFIFSYSIYFSMGVFLFELTNTKNTRYYIIKNIRKFTNIVLCLSVFLMLIAVLFGLLDLKKYGYFLGMLATAFLMLLVLYGRNTKVLLFFKLILINKFSNFLGTISFSLYLVHVPILAVYYTVLAKYTQQFIFYDRIYWIAVICVIPMGYLSYLIFEKNSLILLKKYKEKYTDVK